MARLFAYGTLLDEAVLRRVLGRVPRTRPAVLRGFRRGAHPEGPWPAVEADPRAVVEGRLLEGLSGGELDRIDAYEGVAEGLYARTTATVEAGGRPVRAFVYVKV